MAAHRKSDRRRDDLCAGGLHRGASHRRCSYHFVIAVWRAKEENPPMKMNTLSLILVSLLTGFAFLQPAHSATNNTAFGDGALENNQGNNNTAFGHSPLRFNIFGKQNTATGAFALNKNDL